MRAGELTSVCCMLHFPAQLRESGLQLAEAGRATGGSHDDDEEEETWEEVLDENYDPWMRDPASPEDALESLGILQPAGDGSEGAAAAVSAYEREPLPSMDWQDFQQARAGEPAGTWAVLDVRKQPAAGGDRWVLPCHACAQCVCSVWLAVAHGDIAVLFQCFL